MQGSNFNRRDLIRAALLGAAAAPLCTPELAAAASAKLDEKDPEAVAYAYVADASKVDPKKFPNYKLGQTCGGCTLVQGREGFWRPCTLFPRKVVFHKGWCSAWAQKTFK